MTEKRADVMTGDAGDWQSVDDYPQWLKDRLAWFQDLKFGLFIHWGIYCQWNCIESWPLVEEDTWARPDDMLCWVERGKDLERFRADYRALNQTFNPVGFDPESWADAARRAGMKYVCFTTKHHDGFCMWDTKTTDYRITHPSCPFHTHSRANVVKEVFDVFRERDFAVSCYFSKSDWHCPWYWAPGRPAPDRNPSYDTSAEPEVWEQFVQFVHAQVKELMSDYGKIDILWLDGGQVRPPAQDIRMDEMVAMARALQPGLMVADRTVGGEHENIITPEQEIPDATLGRAWESCITMGDGWSYRENDTYKSAACIIEMLADIVAKGGNLILNIGPSPDGKFDPVALDRLEDVGKWMDINSEAIYGTTTLEPYANGRIRYTKKGDTAYAIVLPEENAELPPEKLTLHGVRPADGSQVVLLGTSDTIPWSVTAGGAELQLPKISAPGGHAWVLRFPLAPEG